MRTAFDELIAGLPPSRCVIVAEIGVNHNGSVHRALQLVEEAKRAGADAVKLQLYVPQELCSRRHRENEMQMLADLRLTDDDHANIVAHARRIGIPIFATAFDEPSLALLVRLDLPVIKLGSGEITHTPLLAAAARAGRPLILSTGACELADIDRAVRTVHENDGHSRAHDNSARRLTLLHCVSAYPPPDEEANLRVIPLLKERYSNCLIGYSDHTIGVDAGPAAIALGVSLLEKHLTLNTEDKGPDHAASADPATFSQLVRAVRRVEALLGDGVKRRMPCEPIIGRSVVAARFLPEGHELRAEDLAFRRPGRGVRPHDSRKLIGHKLARAVQEDELILVEDVR